MQAKTYICVRTAMSRRAAELVLQNVNSINHFQKSFLSYVAEEVH